MNNANLPAYVQRHWAKTDQSTHHRRIHLLEHHLADVSACFEALLKQPTLRKRLARAGGRGDLDEATAARLCVLAALHDVGKVNIGFQTQIWRAEDLPPPRKRPPRTGHDRDLAPILTGADGKTAQWFSSALGWNELLGWDDCGGETVCALFIAALSHHGLPLNLRARGPNPSIWRPFGELNPQRCVERIARLARKWFPAAFAREAPPLPSPPEFQHAFLGLCTLADWIGSDKNRFPYHDEPQDDYIDLARARAAKSIREVGLDIEKQREEFQGVPEFSRLFGFEDAASPNSIQKQAALATPLDERLAIVESETGSGKTEAALWRFARMYEKGLVDGIYFALPTRAAASQMHERIIRFVGSLFPGPAAPEPLLAAPGYLRAGDASGKRLHDYQVWWDDHPDDATRNRRWAAESAKRCLAAQIAVGTVDQAMMAALRVKHAHMRAACLSRNLLVVDEVHASDPYMRTILEALLDAHFNAGGYALLMSATLGSVARRRWLLGNRRARAETCTLESAIEAPYPAVSTASDGNEAVAAAGGNEREKAVRIEPTPAMPEFALVAGRALQAARAGAKVLIVRNTVNFAIRTQQALEEETAPGERHLLFSLGGLPTLHHGRFAVDDRKQLDRRVEELLGKGGAAGGLVVVGTQTLEQSLDIDADLLITDLCPVDVLLQRIGRLHRHDRRDRPGGFRDPVCLVLMPAAADLTPLLTQRRDTNGLGPNGFVYEDLRILEATRRLMEGGTVWRIPQMNRALVERSTHPDAMEAIETELGNDWIEHGGDMAGAGIAGDLTAHSAVARRDKSFLTDNEDVLFGSVEERIRTRLGDEGIRVEFEPPPPSPFSAETTIAEMAIPAHMGGVQPSGEPIDPDLIEGGFAFQVGGRELRYDRLGLRREG